MLHHRLLILLTFVLFPVVGYAQSPPSIERYRIGLPTGQAGQEGGRARNGSWAPVAITLRGGKEGNPQGVFRLRIETTDLEEIVYQVTVPVPALAADTLRTVFGYIVPAGDGATFRILMETTEGKSVRTLALPSRESGKDSVVNAEDIFFFAAGGTLSNLGKALDKIDRPDGKEVADPEAGQRRLAFANDVTLLPDRWIGYDSVDVIILPTGNREFVLQLAQDNESTRRNALLEWVRRGGQLVISAGRNKQEVAQLLAKMPILDVKITDSEVVKALPVVSSQWSEHPPHLPGLQQVEVATIVPGARVNVLVRENRKPIIVQSAFGLGRVMLVAFDLDSPPFSTWEGQDAFWLRLHKEVAPSLPQRRAGKPGADAPVPVRPRGPRGFGMIDDRAFDLRAQWKAGMESFEATPTVSFGWVALFILFYIVLVGPLDYFILKKLFKRLEWTWITFPLLVVLVSVAAYWTAYSLKGDDLRINKIDLVDIDLNQPSQVYGTSWFTLFSPRVASYTIGIEPASDSWTAPVPEGAPGAIVTLLEVGDRTFRAGSQELFRRPYLYADEETGMRRVPIPVWATRSFTANWRAPLRAKTGAIDINDDVGPLRYARDDKGLVGRITNNLPVRLSDIILIYRERRYSLGNLEPGEQKRIEPLFAADAQGQNTELSRWFEDTLTLAPGMPLVPSGRTALPRSFQSNPRESHNQLKRMLFFRAADESNWTNAGLRRIDQTWRLRHLPEYPIPERPRYRDEVILVGRTPMIYDRAEEVTTDAGSPTRLWLGALPADGGERPAVRGYITQETYVRVFIPIQTDR